MNWMFWKPVSEPEVVPEPEPEKLYIPFEHAEKVLGLADAYYALPRGQDRVAEFRLWRGIFVALDISKDTDETYTLSISNVLKPFITRKTS